MLYYPNDSTANHGVNFSSSSPDPITSLTYIILKWIMALETHNISDIWSPRIRYSLLYSWNSTYPNHVLVGKIYVSLCFCNGLVLKSFHSGLLYIYDYIYSYCLLSLMFYSLPETWLHSLFRAQKSPALS